MSKNHEFNFPLWLTSWIVPTKNFSLFLPRCVQLWSKTCKFHWVKNLINNFPLYQSPDSLSSDKITMFQIETIILNTSLIQITEKSIPENFLKSPTINSTATCNESLVNSSEKIKANFSGAATSQFQPLDKAAKFPSYFNTLDLLKANSKKWKMQ